MAGVIPLATFQNAVMIIKIATSCPIALTGALIHGSVMACATVLATMRHATMMVATAIRLRVNLVYAMKDV